MERLLELFSDWRRQYGDPLAAVLYLQGGIWSEPGAEQFPGLLPRGELFLLRECRLHLCYAGVVAALRAVHAVHGRLEPGRGRLGGPLERTGDRHGDGVFSDKPGVRFLAVTLGRVSRA